MVKNTAREFTIMFAAMFTAGILSAVVVHYLIGKSKRKSSLSQLRPLTTAQLTHLTATE